MRQNYYIYIERVWNIAAKRVDTTLVFQTIFQRFCFVCSEYGTLLSVLKTCGAVRCTLNDNTQTYTLARICPLGISIFDNDDDCDYSLRMCDFKYTKNSTLICHLR